MAFNNAHEFSIGNATFTNSTTNVVENPRPLPSQPADILHLARAVGASHRSSSAAYAKKCHPETREEVITDIVDWVVGGEGPSRHSSTRESILWFSGPAGGGKTCIMRNVVDKCEATGLLVASYFFSTRGSGLSRERPFVATIVHQLTISQPDLKKEVFDIIQGYPTIFEESLDFQLDELLVRPLQSTPLLPRSRKIVIAIDGLDECSEELEREHLLNLLHALVIKLPRLITVIVASRPEFDLRRVFASSKLSSVTTVIQLQDYDGTDDIWVFLCDAFEQIRLSHPLKMLIPEGWPLEDIVQLLVDKSSGNFILPSIVAKYIEKSRRNPVDSLNIMVGVLGNSSPHMSNPLADLDAIYSHILQPPNTDLALMKRILHCLLALTDPVDWHANILDELLGLLPGTTATALCELHAIIFVPDSEGIPITFHHKTLEDYLLDPTRSQDLFQSRYDTHRDLTIACAEHLRRWDANPVVDTPMSCHYACVFWESHLNGCLVEKPASEIPPDTILNMDPRIWMRYAFIDGGIYRLSVLRHRRIHQAFCSEQRCVRLCQLLSHVRACFDKCEVISDAFDSFDDKLEGLAKFTSETGLYAPVHPDSRTVFDEKDPDGRLESPPAAVGR